MNMSIISGYTTKGEIKLNTYGNDSENVFCFVDILCKRDYKSTLRDKRTNKPLLDENGDIKKGYETDVITLKFNCELAKIIAKNKPSGVSRYIEVIGHITTYTKDTTDVKVVMPDGSISMKTLPFTLRPDPQVILEVSKLEWRDDKRVTVTEEDKPVKDNIDTMIDDLSKMPIIFKGPKPKDTPMFNPSLLGDEPSF